MEAVEGIITVTQEGRFKLVTESGQVIDFVLSHANSVEPQDLPSVRRERRRVRVEYTKPARMLAHVAHTLRAAGGISSKGI